MNSLAGTTREPVAGAQDDIGAQGGGDRRQVLGRVGLAQRAADRASVADDRVRDDILRVVQDLVVLADTADERMDRCRVMAPMAR